MEGYHKECNEDSSGKEDINISDLEKKRNIDEEAYVVDDFFNGKKPKLIIHSKRKMTLSDVIEFAFGPLLVTPYTQAMNYLYEKSKTKPKLLSKLSPLQNELKVKGNHYEYLY